MNKYFSQEFDHWLKQNALAMDQQTGYDAVVFNAMAKQSLFALGVPNKFQGRGDTKFQDAFYALIEVAKRSLNAAFILWAQRGVIHFLLQHKQHVGSQKLLPKLVKGELAAATALSNLIKHLGGVEELQTQAIPSTNGWKVNGLLPWVTNVQENRFMVVFAAQTGKDKAGVFFAFNTQPNLSCAQAHRLHSIQSSATAAIKLSKCTLTNRQLLAPCAAHFVKHMRPQFLTLQCALSLGVGLASCQAVIQNDELNVYCDNEAHKLKEKLNSLAKDLLHGVEKNLWFSNPKALFEKRIKLAKLTKQSALLELQAMGGQTYLKGAHEETLRRVREALLLPLITPTVLQLQQQL